jgi:large subunit ribosomal protein L31e
MGKKSNHIKSGKEKKVAKELEAKTTKATLNIHRRLYKATFKRKAPHAIKKIKDAARRAMLTEDVRVDPILNQHLWRNGVRNLDRKLNVVYERKKNEDEEAKNKFYTLVKLA